MRRSTLFVPAYEIIVVGMSGTRYNGSLETSQEGVLRMKRLVAILAGVVLLLTATLLTSNAQRGRVVTGDTAEDCTAQCRQSINPNRDQYARAAYEECVKQCERQKTRDIEDDASGRTR
jgi:hypothetical protein